MKEQALILLADHETICMLILLMKAIYIECAVEIGDKKYHFIFGNKRQK